MFRIIKRAAWIVLGGAAVWFFDPEKGPQRRAELKLELDQKDELGTSTTSRGEIVAA